MEYSEKELDEEYLSAIYKYGVLAKSKSMWKSQDEWRLVSCDNLLADNYNCKFYPITRVYLGVNMINNQRREIIDICKRKGVPYVGVVRNNERYQERLTEVLYKGEIKNCSTCKNNVKFPPPHTCDICTMFIQI